MQFHLPAEAPASVREVQDRIYRAVQRQAHYLLGTVHPWPDDAALRLLTDSKSGEHWIRPNTGALEGFAFLHRFGPYDEKVTGVSRPELLSGTIVPMMRYLVATHVTGTRPTSDGRKWGDAWQSAHWAHMLGRGAWFVWPQLPVDLREGVRRVVAHKADRIARSEPPHQLRSDTKAEENAWNSQVLSVAMLLLPDDPRRAGWEKAHQKWVMSSFLRPADERNETVVDGRPVREQFTGANIFDDFTLENHDFVHPDYMTTFSLSLGCAPDFAMTGRRIPEALLFNVAPIYENLKWMLLPDGGFVYPNGQDWELFRNPSWLGKHVLMAEKLVALMNVTTAEVATGLIGILNNPHWIHEQARRRVAADDRLIEVASGRGQQWHWDAARRIVVDDVLVVQSERPLRASYLAADRAERGRVTDQLVLNHLPGNRTWTTGETLSDYEVVVRCVKASQ